MLPEKTAEKRLRIRELRDFCPPTYLPTLFAIVGHIARADFTIENLTLLPKRTLNRGIWPKIAEIHPKIRSGRNA
jgi:hypothetical protein